MVLQMDYNSQRFGIKCSYLQKVPIGGNTVLSTFPFEVCYKVAVYPSEDKLFQNDSIIPDQRLQIKDFVIRKVVLTLSMQITVFYPNVYL